MKKRVFVLLTTLLALSGCFYGGSSSSDSTSEIATSDSSISESETSNSSSSEEENFMSTEEVLQNMKATPFSTDIRTNEDLGIADLTRVGVDSDRFANETKFAIPSEGTFYKAEDYGISPSGDNNTGALSILLKNIISVSGNKIIQFQDAIYPFSGTVDVTGIKDVYLVGKGSTEFVYSGWGTYFEAKASQNIHLSNIAFDMKNSPTISGTITRVDDFDQTADIYLSIPEEFDLTNTLYTSWKGETGSYMECYFDEVTQKYVPDRNHNLFYNSPTSASSKGIASASYSAATREFKVTLNKSFPYCQYKAPIIGANVSFAFTMYENHGFHFYQCQDVYMEDINVYVTGGMGMRIDMGKNVYFNRVNFMNRPGSKRIMTCTADIIHSAALEGDLQISNCLLEGSHDDALNIKTFYTKVVSVNASAKEIEVQQTQTEVLISYEIGDTIDIYDPETMGLIGSYTITDLVKLGSNYTLTVDSRPRDIPSGANVGNATKTTSLLLDNCIIRNKRNRGILLQTRNSIIQNCTFQNVVMGAIQVLAVYDIFREAIVPQNIKIINNKFLTNYEDVSIFAYGSKGSANSVPSTIKNVEVSNNFFFNGQSLAINLLATGTGLIQNNLFYYDSFKADRLIRAQASENLTISGNVLINDSTQTLTFIDVASGQIGITLENNSERKSI